jgi:hypothetical protein
MREFFVAADMLASFVLVVRTLQLEYLISQYFTFRFNFFVLALIAITISWALLCRRLLFPSADFYGLIFLLANEQKCWKNLTYKYCLRILKNVEPSEVVGG